MASVLLLEIILIHGRRTRIDGFSILQLEFYIKMYITYVVAEQGDFTRRCGLMF